MACNGKFWLAVTLLVAISSFSVEGRPGKHGHDGANGERRHGKHGHHGASDAEGGIPQQLNDLIHPEQSSLYDYNPSMKPDGLVTVTSTAFIRMLGPICTHKNALSMQITYRESFIDKRIEKMLHNNDEHDHDQETEVLNISGEDFSQYLWTPDTFFRNSISEELLGSIAENTYARIYSNGKIVVSRRLQLKLACPNFVKKFKASGKATCDMHVASYGERKNGLTYQWAETEPVQHTSEINSMLGTIDDKAVKLEKFETGECDVTTATGSYSCINIKFHFVATDEEP